MNDTASQSIGTISGINRSSGQTEAQRLFGRCRPVDKAMINDYKGARVLQ